MCQVLLGHVDLLSNIFKNSFSAPGLAISVLSSLWYDVVIQPDHISWHTYQCENHGWILCLHQLCNLQKCYSDTWCRWPYLSRHSYLISVTNFVKVILSLKMLRWVDSGERIWNAFWPMSILYQDGHATSHLLSHPSGIVLMQTRDEE